MLKKLNIAHGVNTNFLAYVDRKCNFREALLSEANAQKVFYGPAALGP